MKLKAVVFSICIALLGFAFAGCNDSNNGGAAGSDQKYLLEIPKGVAE